MSKPKDKLKKFTEFTQSILPLEVEFIKKYNNFQDSDNKYIIDTIIHNSAYPEDNRKFDTSVDKRKYSKVMKWIDKKLLDLDVDNFYNRICDIDNKITTDSISSEEEKSLLNDIKKFESHYFFIAFYEMVRNYSNYLLIRHRHSYYEVVYSFLDKYKERYKNAVEINEKLHKVTSDIISQFSDSNIEALKWEEWLINVFYDKNLDGRSRFLAVVRLTYLYYTNKKFDKMEDLYVKLSELFNDGSFYSKRLLVNFYANQAMLNYKLNNLEEAEYYGHLSLKYKTNEYLHYINTLCAVLLKGNKLNETLSLIRSNFSEIKLTNSLYNVIGFVSFYITCLNKSNKAIEAEFYADNFIEIHRKNLFKDRWHLFFSVYLQSLFIQEKYKKVIRQIRKHKLLELELKFKDTPGYYPIILWYHNIAIYKEVKISENHVIDELSDSASHLISQGQRKKTDKIVAEIKNYAPVISKRVKLKVKNL